jgi:predicted Zn-dependent protease
LINVSRLKAGDVPAEQLALRVQRQVVRSLGFLFGVGYCLDPRCVHRPCPTVSDLDKMGRNFSPPCLSAWLDQAVLRGLSPLPRRTKLWQTREKGGKPRKGKVKKED